MLICQTRPSFSPSSPSSPLMDYYDYSNDNHADPEWHDPSFADPKEFLEDLCLPETRDDARSKDAVSTTAATTSTTSTTATPALSVLNAMKISSLLFLDDTVKISFSSFGLFFDDLSHLNTLSITDVIDIHLQKALYLMQRAADHAIAELCIWKQHTGGIKVTRFGRGVSWIQIAMVIKDQHEERKDGIMEGGKLMRENRESFASTAEVISFFEQRCEIFSVYIESVTGHYFQQQQHNRLMLLNDTMHLESLYKGMVTDPRDQFQKLIKATQKN